MSQRKEKGNSLVIQWLRTCLPVQRTWGFVFLFVCFVSGKLYIKIHFFPKRLLKLLSWLPGRQCMQWNTYIPAFYFGELCYKCFYHMCLTVAGRSMKNNIYLCDHIRLMTHDCICCLNWCSYFVSYNPKSFFPYSGS